MGLCDDPQSKFYNKLVKLPSKFSHEKLYRKDNIYNIAVVLDYNLNPIIKNKGSAIFIHVAKKNYKATQGCIGLKQKELIKLIQIVKKNQRIRII
jgi:L,D-peptidoglycan transpeptidase YkuD (ErfK/YbiS/YcfS/YnhG family)